MKLLLSASTVGIHCHGKFVKRVGRIKKQFTISISTNIVSTKAVKLKQMNSIDWGATWALEGRNRGGTKGLLIRKKKEPKMGRERIESDSKQQKCTLKM